MHLGTESVLSLTILPSSSKKFLDPRRHCRVVRGLKTDRMSCYLTTLFCAARESNKIQDPGCGERERSVGLMTIEGSVII